MCERVFSDNKHKLGNAAVLLIFLCCYSYKFLMGHPRLAPFRKRPLLETRGVTCMLLRYGHTKEFFASQTVSNFFSSHCFVSSTT